jgi:modulator of FtsH protease HflC
VTHRRRAFALLGIAALVWLLSGTFFAVDVAQFALVTRFGRVTSVVSEPGLHVKMPLDRVVRLSKRLLSSRPAAAEYLTVDKRNLVIDSVATWRISDPLRFQEALGARSGAERRLLDVMVAEIGACLGRYPAAALISTRGEASGYRSVVAEIRDRVAAAVGKSYGIEIVDLDILALSLPEQNKEHVYERMKAERGKIAKEFRSSGELAAKKIIAAADRERSHIETEAYAQAQRLKGEGDAEASQIYAEAFGRDASFYKFMRTLQSYEKFVDESTTLFLPADAEVFALLQAKPRQ